MSPMCMMLHDAPRSAKRIELAAHPHRIQSAAAEMLGPLRRQVGRSYPFENAEHFHGLGPLQPDTKAAARSAWPEVRRSAASLRLLHRRNRIAETTVQEMPAQKQGAAHYRSLRHSRYRLAAPVAQHRGIPTIVGGRAACLAAGTSRSWKARCQPSGQREAIRRHACSICQLSRRRPQAQTVWPLFVPT